MMDAFVTSPVVGAIGWALVQSLWQGALVGALTALALGLLQRRAANLRYLVAGVGLLAMLAAPVATAVTHATHGPSGPAPRGAALQAPAPGLAGTTAGVESGARSGAGPVAPVSRPSRGGFDAWPAGVVLAWLAGMLVLLVRLFAGWLLVERVRRARCGPVPGVWHGRVKALARAVGVTRRVRIAVSRRIAVPMVIGWIRPVLLLPCAALANLSPAQLEAVIAHELAHIRRHDYLVNLLQTTVETALFYHPAAWWLSRRIRLEREHCCDDVAVALCGDRVTYVRALADLEALRGDAPALGVAVTSGPLVARVRRLLGVPAPRDGQPVTWVVLALLLGALSLVLAADEPGQSTVPGRVATVEDGAIGGRVVDVVSGRAVAGASVTAVRNGAVAGDVADSAGRYEVAGLVPGSYQVYVDASGYVPAQYGARHFTDGGTTVQVGRGQTVTGVDVDLQPAGGVSGRIVDQSGRGVHGVEIVVSPNPGPTGAGSLGAGGFAQTDAAGDFRVGGLAPGPYVVRAYLPQEGSPSGAEIHAPTYFPRGTRVEDAQPVFVAAGLDSVGVEFALETVAPFVVSGTVADAAGRPVDGAEIHLMQLGVERTQKVTSEEGRFSVGQVLPGQYMISAVHSGASLLRTQERLTVADRDVTDLELTLMAGARITGRVVGPGIGPLPFDPARLELRAASQVPGVNGNWGINAIGGAVHSDGTFSIGSVIGRSVIQVENLPDGWSLESVRRRGVDITDEPAEFGEGTENVVEITLANRTTELTGSVRGARGLGVSDYTVIVFPSDPARRHRLSRRLKGARQRQDGRYRIEGLPPGSYLAVAVETLPRTAWNDPAVLERLQARGQSFRLRAGERRALDLRLSPLPEDLRVGF